MGHLQDTVNADRSLSYLILFYNLPFKNISRDSFIVYCVTWRTTDVHQIQTDVRK